MIDEKLLKRARVDEGNHDDVKDNRATDKERVEASGSGLNDEQRAAGRGEQEARQQFDMKWEEMAAGFKRQAQESRGAEPKRAAQGDVRPDELRREEEGGR